MSGRVPVPVLSAIAVILTATSLSAVFSDRGWQIPVFGAAAVAVHRRDAGAGGRRGGAVRCVLGVLLSARVSWRTCRRCSPPRPRGSASCPPDAPAARSTKSSAPVGTTSGHSSRRRQPIRGWCCSPSPAPISSRLSPTPSPPGWADRVWPDCHCCCCSPSPSAWFTAASVGCPSSPPRPDTSRCCSPRAAPPCAHGAGRWRPSVRRRRGWPAGTAGPSGTQDRDEAARAAGLLGVTGRRIGIAAVGVALVRAGHRPVECHHA